MVRNFVCRTREPRFEGRVIVTVFWCVRERERMSSAAVRMKVWPSWLKARMWVDTFVVGVSWV